MTTSPKGVALITGASSGIGAAYADRLAHQGYDLVLVARNAARLDTLATRLRAATGRSVETLPADLGQPGGVESVERVLRSNTELTMLVNNAGVGSVAPLLDAEADAMQAMIELNVTALTRLTYAFVPGVVARGGGTIVNMASIVGLAPEALNGVYGATKAFVLALSQSLHHELGQRGLRVHAVLPGATATEFWRAAGQPVENLPAEMVMSVDDLVDAALAGLDLGELVTIPSLPDQGQWDAYDAARRELRPHLSAAVPAPRYRP